MTDLQDLRISRHKDIKRQKKRNGLNVIASNKIRKYLFYQASHKCLNMNSQIKSGEGGGA